MSNSTARAASRMSALPVRQTEIKSRDAAILIVAGFGLVGVTVAVYALAVGFGIEQQIIELLRFMP